MHFPLMLRSHSTSFTALHPSPCTYHRRIYPEPEAFDLEGVSHACSTCVALPSLWTQLVLFGSSSAQFELGMLEFFAPFALVLFTQVLRDVPTVAPELLSLLRHLVEFVYDTDAASHLVQALCSHPHSIPKVKFQLGPSVLHRLAMQEVGVVWIPTR